MFLDSLCLFHITVYYGYVTIYKYFQADLFDQYIGTYKYYHFGSSGRGSNGNEAVTLLSPYLQNWSLPVKGRYYPYS